MTKTPADIPASRTWKDIPQYVKPRAMSRGGRRRVWMNTVKTVTALAIFGGIGWGIYEVVLALDENSPGKTVLAKDAVPIKEPIPVTDGVLDRVWLARTLALPKKVTLMDLDLFKLREQILASGQVINASLTRSFPSTLLVTLTERSPVARIMAQRGGEAPRALMVARDGVVFDGVNFPPEMIAALPWIDGVQLVLENGRFRPIQGMSTIADLLTKAQNETPHLYSTWTVVSLARLASDGEIEVKTPAVNRVIFGTQEDFFPQLARLDLLLDAARQQPEQTVREINLAIGANVPVSFTPAAALNKTSLPGGKPSSPSNPFKKE